MKWKDALAKAKEDLKLTTSEILKADMMAHNIEIVKLAQKYMRECR